MVFLAQDNQTQIEFSAATPNVAPLFYVDEVSVNEVTATTTTYTQDFNSISTTDGWQAISPSTITVNNGQLQATVQSPTAQNRYLPIFSKKVSTIPGKTYIFEFDLNLNGLTDMYVYSAIEVDAANGLYDEEVYSYYRQDMPLHKYHTFVAHSNETYIEFYHYASTLFTSPASVYADNFTLREISGTPGVAYKPNYKTAVDYFAFLNSVIKVKNVFSGFGRAV